MNNFIKAASVLSIAFVTVISSCKKKEDPELIVDPGANKGSVHMEFFNRVGDDPLAFGTTQYTNSVNQLFTVSKFNYYISNIKLTKEDGSQYTENESYHLLQQSAPESLNFDLADVPNGTYKSITFMIGVDSFRNVAGAQTGALDQANAMFWDWNSGYIMMKFEGNSTSSPDTTDKLIFHMGGFSGANSVLRTVTLTFPNDLVVESNKPHMHVKADVKKLFSGANTIDFTSTYVLHMPGADAKKFADNYQQMFSVTAVGE